MVPTRANCGASGSFLRTTAVLTIAGSAATAEGGGRRDGEKIGRSRVADNWVNGIAHSGLALCTRSGARPVGGATTRTVVTCGTSGAAVTTAARGLGIVGKIGVQGVAGRRGRRCAGDIEGQRK